MGSLQLECPLCCNEIFEDKQALKYHLLSFVDNIICPACDKRCQTVLDLAEHLGNDCCDRKDECAGDLIAQNQIFIKEEVEDIVDEPFGNSILAKALLNKNIKNEIYKTNNKESETEAEKQDAEMQDVENDADKEFEEGVYSCVGCGMSFTNLIEHINQYHDEEEVVVEMQNEDEELKDGDDILKSISEGKAIISDDTIETVMIPEYDDDEEMYSNEDSQEVDGNSKSRLPQLLNTLKQENCVDKDGRLYTRKVVQIEKFWMERKNLAVRPKDPIVVKYTADDDGVMTKVEEGDDIPVNVQTMEIYQCGNCNVQFHKRAQFDSHTCDPEIGSEYKCSMCDSSFTNAQTLSSHMKQHKKQKVEASEASSLTGPFICNVCDTNFATNKSLRLHKRMHDPVKSKEVDPPVDYGIMGNNTITKPREMFECQICGKSYDKTYEEIHMAYHSGINNYDCFICNRKFYTASNLEMHMRVHTNEKGHLCTHCRKFFITEDELEEHIKEHSIRRPYQCSYCARRFARPHEKVKHERIHTGEKPHECEICGKTFRVSYCLTLHMRTHSGLRPYVCQHCGKRFKAHSVYNHHLLTHSDVRGYKCPYCPKAFKTGVQLAGHKNSHTKPFSCTQCNRPFASLYAVRAHMETHKRENNLKYNCYLCGASYARAFALRDHIKEAHVDAPQNGDISLDIIEEGYEATSAILPENDDMSIVTLDMANNDTEIEEEIIGN